MTTRERIEWALHIIHGDLQRKCFYCEYESNVEFVNDCQRQLAIALVKLGVPRGIYETFALRENHVNAAVEHCGMTDKPDPDWQKFIDEVVLLVGE